jgi:hypothetical protein
MLLNLLEYLIIQGTNKQCLFYYQHFFQFLNHLTLHDTYIINIPILYRKEEKNTNELQCKEFNVSCENTASYCIPSVHVIFYRKLHPTGNPLISSTTNLLGILFPILYDVFFYINYYKYSYIKFCYESVTKRRYAY